MNNNNRPSIIVHHTTNITTQKARGKTGKIYENYYILRETTKIPQNHKTTKRHNQTSESKVSIEVIQKAANYQNKQKA